MANAVAPGGAVKVSVVPAHTPRPTGRGRPPATARRPVTVRSRTEAGVPAGVGADVTAGSPRVPDAPR